MIKLEQAERIYQSTKNLRKEAKKYHKLREREDAMFQNLANYTTRQTQKLCTDINWQANYIERLQHQLHLAVVETGVAAPFEDDYYGTREARLGHYAMAHTLKAPKSQTSADGESK